MARLTGNPDDALALIVKGGSPYVLSAMGSKLIVCDACTIANVRDTGGAALKPPPPAWIAVMVQLPRPVAVTAEPLTEQCPKALKLTGSPDEAVAVTVKGWVKKG